jgi:hypothetical protein
VSDERLIIPGSKYSLACGEYRPGGDGNPQFIIDSVSVREVLPDGTLGPDLINDIIVIGDDWFLGPELIDPMIEDLQKNAKTFGPAASDWAWAEGDET